MGQYWGLALEQLPYDGREGGYLGRTWSSEGILFGEIALSLPRDRDGRLYEALCDRMPDDLWCDFDWIRADYDEVLINSWNRFCELVKHERRFFFQNRFEDDEELYSPAALLVAVAEFCIEHGYIRLLDEGTQLWKSRPDLKESDTVDSAEFGPVPKARARQSNRMNPAGIPLLYLASTPHAALAETSVESALVGSWRAARPLKVLDLRTPPEVPGFFADVDREHRLSLLFLRHFAEEIVKPIAREEKINIEYLPTQVVAEFMRDRLFRGEELDGIAFGSSVCQEGWNLALFAAPIDLGLAEPMWGEAPAPWLRYEGYGRVAL